MDDCLRVKLLSASAASLKLRLRDQQEDRTINEIRAAARNEKAAMAMAMLA